MPMKKDSIFTHTLIGFHFEKFSSYTKKKKLLWKIGNFAKEHRRLNKRRCKIFDKTNSSIFP